MATLDDLFGNKNDGSKRFMKFENDGEMFRLVQTDEPKLVPQKNPQTGKNTWLVQVNEGDKYQPKDEGTFNEDEVHNAFMPNKNIVIPVRVVGKKLANGSKDENFEEFDSEWELTRDQTPKFKEAMLDTGVAAEAGTIYLLKRLSSKQKPYTYAIKMEAGS